MWWGACACKCFHLTLCSQLEAQGFYEPSPIFQYSSRPAMVFQVGDMVKRGGEEEGEVKAVVGDLMIVQVGDTQVAGPVGEWEVVSLLAPVEEPEDTEVYDQVAPLLLSYRLANK